MAGQNALKYRTPESKLILIRAAMTKIEQAAREWIRERGGPFVRNSVTVFAEGTPGGVSPITEHGGYVDSYVAGARYVLQKATEKVNEKLSRYGNCEPEFIGMEKLMNHLESLFEEEGK